MGEDSRVSSELCKACEIFSICHEGQKTVAKSCIHFKGDLPNGYFKYRSIAVRFIRKKGFASNIGYLDLPKKVWLEQGQLNNLRALAEKEAS